MTADGGIARCGGCGSALASVVTRYCSNACRQRAYRRRVVGSARLSTFVGRDHDLAEGRRILRGARLLTVTGPPGAGKSRLAQEIAGRGAMVVDLCDPGALARVDLSRVGELLVLDNCDRVLETLGPAVMDLLARHPHLRIITTSREPWRLSGEVTYRLSGLSLPDEGMTGSPDECLRADAVRLLVDRAVAADRTFTLNRENVADVAAICVLLDGLPLALELAAQLLRALPVAEARRRVAEEPAVLGQGWRTADFRHRSWTAALRWSYDGLTEAERVIFRRVSLLPGTFSIEAVQVACPDLAAEAPLRLVGLEAKSLITARPTGFTVPNSVRGFGRREAIEAGEREDVLERLAAWLGDLSRWRVDRPEDLERLCAERDTVRTLLDWLAPTSDERRLSLAWALGVIDSATGGDPVEALSAVERALPVAGRYRAEAYEAALLLACWNGHGERALRLAAEGVRVAAGVPLARLRVLAGLAQEMYGDRAAVPSDLLAALEIARRHDDVRLVAVCRGHLARHLLQHGRPDAARTLLAKSLPVLRAAAPSPDMCAALVTAGALSLDRDDVDRASTYFTEILAVPYRPGVCDAVVGLALCAVRTRNFERALTLIAAAAGRHSSALLLFPSWRDQLDPAHAIATGALSKSQAATAVTTGRQLTHEQLVRYAREGCSTARRHGDDVLTPREWEVIHLVMDGLTNFQIAHRMFLSVRTVETHIRNIRTVLDLRSRAHMAAWAARRSQRAA
ncbi:LuxR C-terminal-related transcriptional regulator [Actinoplanes sp. NPDC051470]|uniref:ATP-binding protein n=1 Tax=Actinoplanes sp. NPDC051470 TaxID=3157224 RepID=UPI003439DD9C